MTGTIPHIKFGRNDYMKHPFNKPHNFGLLLPVEEAPANPPFINWYRSESADRYRVTVRGADVVHTAETPWNFYTPPIHLAPGVFTVSVESLDASGLVMEIDSRETRLGEPLPDAALNLNALQKRPGTRLFLSDADVKQLRSAESERKEWRDRLLAQAADVEPELLVDLKEPEAYPKGIWNFDTWKANNTVCIAVEDALFAATTAWRMTEDTRYLEPAVLLISRTVDWDPHGSTGVWENDHSTQAFLHAYSVAYDTFGVALPSELRASLRENIAARCQDIYEFLNPFHKKQLSCGWMGDPANNHAWFVAEAMGLGGLALWDEHPDARKWVALAAQLHTGAFFPYGDSEGGWHEGIDYWSYSFLFTFEFLDALLDTTGIDLYQHPWLRKTTSFKMMAHPPAGGYVPFGDVKHHSPLAVDRLIAMRLASRHADPLEWRYVDSIQDKTIDRTRYLPHALAWSDRGGITPEAAALAEPPVSAFYRDMGWIVLNSDHFRADEQVLFAFRSGGKHPDAVSHNHADINSFILCVSGERLLWDAGYYDSYGSPHHNGYSRQSKAHNTLLVNGQGQVMKYRGAFGSITRFTVEGMDVEIESDASHPLVYAGAVDTWIRRARLRDLANLSIEDEIITSEPSALSLLLHSVYPIVWHPGDSSVTIRGNRVELTGRIETSEPVDVTISTHFSEPCNVRSALLDTADEYPDQYHLEIKTARPVSSWSPRMVFSWTPIGN